MADQSLNAELRLGRADTVPQRCTKRERASNTSRVRINNIKDGLCGEVFRHHSVFWAAGWSHLIERPLSNLSEHLSKVLGGEPRKSARPPPERKRPGFDSANRQPSFVDMKFSNNKPNQRAGLYRSNRGLAIAGNLRRLFAPPSGGPA